MIARAAIVVAARAWLGTRWHHQASVRGVGTDCIGLIAGVARDLGIAEAQAWAADPASQGYGRVPDPGMLLASVERYLRPVALHEAGAGDILLLRFVSEPQHFAILSADYPRSIIHAWAGARRVVEHRVDALWGQRVVGAFRYPGVA